MLFIQAILSNVFGAKSSKPVVTMDCMSKIAHRDSEPIRMADRLSITAVNCVQATASSESGMIPRRA